MKVNVVKIFNRTQKWYLTIQGLAGTINNNKKLKLEGKQVSAASPENA